MTNGEKMQEVFPEGETRRCRNGVVFESDGWCHAYDSDWWNAEYKETTTENNLDVNLISRADAIQAMQNKAKKLTNEDTINGLCGAVAILYEMPSVTPQEPRWIPVSERLPEDSEEYLVSVTDKEDEGYKQVRVAWFAHPKDYDLKDGEWRELLIDEVVTAWMPLPQPYSEVKE